MNKQFCRKNCLFYDVCSNYERRSTCEDYYPAEDDNDYLSKLADLPKKEYLEAWFEYIHPYT